MEFCHMSQIWKSLRQMQMCCLKATDGPIWKSGTHAWWTPCWSISAYIPGNIRHLRKLLKWVCLFFQLFIFKIIFLPFIAIFFVFAENYHHLYSLLSQLKISVLDTQRKEAKQKYSEALNAYVTLYFGRPLEKLNVSTIVLVY